MLVVQFSCVVGFHRSDIVKVFQKAVPFLADVFVMSKMFYEIRPSVLHFTHARGENDSTSFHFHREFDHFDLTFDTVIPNIQYPYFILSSWMLFGVGLVWCF